VFLLLNIVPLLKSGVLLHIHDVFLPFEYPEEWMVNRRWPLNEQYLVQAILTYGNSFQVLWPGHYFQKSRPDFSRWFGRPSRTRCSKPLAAETLNVRSVVILTGNHVWRNPRAFKEAEALTNAGFDVEWLGGWFDPTVAERDRLLLRNRKWRFTPVTDWTAATPSARRQRQRQRIRRWLGLKRFKMFRWENASQLGYCIPELLREAVQRSADLFIAHSEPALWVARQLQRRGRRVGVDMEDWFSEDLLPEARKERPLRLLRELERSILSTAAHRTCTSNAMNSALMKTYACDPLEVLYNAFPWRDRAELDGQWKDRANRALPSIHWFSQTLGIGRGLDELFAALHLISMPAEVHLRGGLNAENRIWMNQAIPRSWNDRVFVHGLVHNDELLSRIAEHDLAVALDPDDPPSRNVTVTNKILQYLLAGLPVVASNTAGHREIAAQAPGAVFICDRNDPSSLAGALTDLLRSRDSITRARQAALSAAENVFCWERMGDRLVQSVERSLNVHKPKTP
jgi:glycosyltransferase involved in cell wall biosynthesis